MYLGLLGEVSEQMKYFSSYIKEVCSSCSFSYFQKQQVFQGWKCPLGGCNGVIGVHQLMQSKVIEMQIDCGRVKI